MAATIKMNGGYLMYWDEEKHAWEPGGCEPCPWCGKMYTNAQAENAQAERDVDRLNWRIRDITRQGRLR